MLEFLLILTKIKNIMAEFTNKTFEYTDNVASDEHKIKVSILSASENIEISNVDTEKVNGYIFNIVISSEPNISVDYFDMTKQYIYIFGREGEHKFGYLENNNLVELVENRFIQLLTVHIQEILMVAGNAGYFIA